MSEVEQLDCWNNHSKDSYKETILMLSSYLLAKFAINLVKWSQRHINIKDRRDNEFCRELNFKNFIYLYILKTSVLSNVICVMKNN